MACENDRKFKFQCSSIKFYWNTAIPICFYWAAYGCFCAGMAEPFHQKPSGFQSLEYLLFGSLQKGILDLCSQAHGSRCSRTPIVPEKFMEIKVRMWEPKRVRVTLSCWYEVAKGVWEERLQDRQEDEGSWDLIEFQPVFRLSLDFEMAKFVLISLWS